MLVGGDRKLAEFRTRPPSCNDVIVVVVVTLTLMTSRVADAADSRDNGGEWRGGRPAVTWYDDVTEYRHNSVLQRDDPSDEAKRPGECRPCKCPQDPPRCKMSRTVKDGCDCCHVCPRQQGDLCDYRYLCDDRRQLYCDFNVDGGHRGICRAKSGRSCRLDDKVYRDGEEFKPNCSQLCTCQDGVYACASLCPQELRPPSSAHCQHAQLVTVEGQCCREWVCPHSFSLPRPDDDHIHPGEMGGHLPTALLPQTSLNEVRRCSREDTGWSTCSTSCGVGISARVSNNNEQCLTMHERRLCVVRPCGVDDSDLEGEDCKNTWKPATPIHLEHDGCLSVKNYRPKYCSTCKKHRCCEPRLTRTFNIEFICAGNKTIVENYMWIKNCECTETNCKNSSQRSGIAVFV